MFGMKVANRQTLGARGVRRLPTAGGAAPHRCSLWWLVVPAALQAFAGTTAAQQPPPDGFEVSVYAEGLVDPIALAVAPDGRVFFTEKTGRLRVIQDGVVQEPPFATIDVHSDNENGLLGLALDPHFADNGYVYVFASVSADEQQILRFTDAGGVGEERVVIRDHLPAGELVHSGGGLAFGPDGMLYFSVGDTGDAPLAQRMNSLAGKICRIHPDGRTPDDNPFTTPTGAPRAIYALGFRNPFRFTFAPDGRLFVMDVGSNGANRREEINIVRRGGNYGWPLVEGFQASPGDPTYSDPIIAYHEAGQAVTGAVVYTGEQFPRRYVGNLFHLEFVLNRIYRVVLDGDRVVRHEVFLEGQGGLTDIVQDVDGSLLYCEHYGGRIMRIRCTAEKPDDASPTDSPFVADDETSGTPGDAVVVDVLAATEEDMSPPAVAPVGLCGLGGFGAWPLTLLMLTAARLRREGSQRR
ncbi:MAG: hypothetical protein D6744_06245 [Planctomycetota bacterium]|nr:MAG: hypothetical protein D6744_06245 [Planctomycetota bacterium]